MVADTSRTPRTTRLFRLLAAACVGSIVTPIPATSQSSSGDTSHFRVLPSVTGDDYDRLRLADLLGRDSVSSLLLRSASSMRGAVGPDSSGFRWALLAPDAYGILNSGVPFSLNDGALWAGHGINGSLRLGVQLDWGSAWLTVAPEIVYSQNRGVPPTDPLRVQPLPPGRSAFSSPWHTIPLSADLPLRFGAQPLTRLDAGQSSIGVSHGTISAGVANENLWWGPGIRNAVVMSNNAPGFPHLFVRTTHPVRTPAGAVEGTWIVGGLSESAYFDSDSSNDLRSLAGLALAWKPRWIPGLQFGFTRTVFAPARRWSDLPLRFFNVFAPVGRPNARPPSDSTMVPGRDQLFSLFFRWVLPADGFEVYAEWARNESPASLRDLLVAPNHSQGYTLGLQWARPLGRDSSALRVQLEATYLEQSTTYRDRPEGSFYTSRAVIQGYTQRGQIIGAAIGPGASSQWIAVDFLPARWSIGLVGGRIRWEDDALFALPGPLPGNVYCSYDISLFAGIRGSYRSALGRIEGMLANGTRLNPFFVHPTGCDSGDIPAERADRGNTTLELRWSVPLTR